MLPYLALAGGWQSDVGSELVAVAGPVHPQSTSIGEGSVEELVVRVLYLVAATSARMLRGGLCPAVFAGLYVAVVVPESLVVFVVDDGVDGVADAVGGSLYFAAASWAVVLCYHNVCPSNIYSALFI